MKPNYSNPEKKQDAFPVMVFIVALVFGLFVGGFFVRHFAPETKLWMVLGAALPPIGILLGFSAAEGTEAPLALMRVFSVLDGRHTFAEILAASGRTKSSPLVFPASMMTVTAFVCAAGGIVIHIFAKPELGSSEFVSYFGLVGMIYGLVMALLLKFLADDE